YMNWSTGFDMKTGMPIVNPDEAPRTDIKLPDLCPSDLGGKEWTPGAASPRTGLVYEGILNICMQLGNHDAGYIASSPYDGMEIARHAGPGGNLGEFMAWNPATGKKVWSIKEKFMTMSGVLATAGDVVFYGTADGWFRAVDARSGKILWSQKLGSGVVGQPMTYLGPDHRQYIAIYSGIGGNARVPVDKTTPGFPAQGGTLYVFSIDGDSIGNGPAPPTTDGSGTATPARADASKH
ncbi:MAG TPA: PQQ-binding-like beta-propeller repeat protein, partial [Acetobacteraceae bacterium]